MPYDLNAFISEGMRAVTVEPIKIENCIAEYQDARSAAFFAMGNAIKDKKPVVLLLPGQYLTNIYTAITEAWFQKAEVIVYAFYKRISEVNTNWADRCAKTMTIHVDEYEEKADEITSYYHMHSPVLINVVGVNLEESTIDYHTAASAIVEIDKAAKFLCYNGCDFSNSTNIKTEYKYGVLSKYIGMSVARNVGYLLCNDECVSVDVNIFRTRYANDNMKIVVFDSGRLKEHDIDQWIISNGWNCKRIERMNSEAANWLKNQTKQAVLLIG